MNTSNLNQLTGHLHIVVNLGLLICTGLDKKSPGAGSSSGLFPHLREDLASLV